MKNVALALVCLITVGFSASSFAVNWVSILKNTPAERFKDDDLEMFIAASRKALNETPDGQTVSWDNPATKARGSITVDETRVRGGQTCKRVRVENQAGTRKGKQALDVCKGSDGRWALAPTPAPAKKP